MKPRISIVTPVYQAERFLEQTLSSVRAQTFAEWEHLLVVDAKSRDRSLEICREAQRADARMRVIEGHDEGGVSANRNRGLAEARGEYVAFLDADDLWRPSKLEHQFAEMESSSLDFSCHAYDVMTEEGEVLPGVRNVPLTIAFEDLLRNNVVGCLTVMIRRSVLGEERFVEGGHEDLRLWLHLAQKGVALRGLPENLASYRIVRGSRSNNKWRAARWRWRLLGEFPTLHLFDKIKYFALYLIQGILKTR